MFQRPGSIALGLMVVLSLQLFGCDDDDHEDVPPTPTPTATLTFSPTPPATATPTSTRTETSTQLPTGTPTSTSTLSPTATPTSTNTFAPTATFTPIDTFCPASQILVDGDCVVAGAEAGYRIDILQPENPFPDDRYRDANGRITPPIWSFTETSDPNAMSSSASSAFIEGLLTTIRDNATGWGNFSPLEFELSAEVDSATLSQGLVVLRRDGETWSIQHHEFAPTWNPALHILDLQPALPLDASTTYAIVLDSAVKTTDGAPLGRSDDFRRVLRGEGSADLQSALDYAESELEISRDEVALAFTFTTQATWQDLVTVRQRLDEVLPPPAISFEDVAGTRYQEGVFTEGPVKDQLLRGHAANFLLAAVGTAQFYDFRGRDFVFDSAAVNGPTVPRKVPVRVEITVPLEPAPEDGYPVLILGHGLGQSADFTWDVAQGSAEVGMSLPFMVVAADFPNHGARGTGSAVGDVLQYFHLNNFFAMRDSFRETAAELLEVRRLVETSTEPPFNLANKDKILFAGASLGGINGATFLAVDSRVKTALLSVPAGELVRILEGREVGQQIAPVIAALVGLRPTDPGYPDFFRVLINRGLWIMGAGDPISYAPFIIGDTQLPGATRKSVLIQEGIGDGVLPNRTTEDLARVMGVPIVTTETRCDEPGCSVSGMWQFDLADYGLSGVEPHQVSHELPEAQEQLFTYLETDGQVIIDASPMP